MKLEDKPLAYTLSSQPFMDFDFCVDQNVLIPRPETEEMLEVTIRLANNLRLTVDSLKIADIGTGSGCIAVSLAKYFPEAKITAIESSPSALEVAKYNAKMNQVTEQIEFIEGNFFLPLKERKFDLIISNPPYIPTEEIGMLELSVRNWEPHEALDGGADGLDFIRKLVLEGPNYLNENGIIIFEFGFGQGDAIRHLAPNIEIIKDLAGIERIGIIRQ